LFRRPTKFLEGALASSRVDERVRARLRRIAWAVFGFGLVLNGLLLVPSLYMLQVYDRVLTSRSLETLAMLTLFAAFVLAVIAVLDTYRANLMAVFSQLIASLQAGTQAAVTPDGELAQRGLRDIATVRSYLASPSPTALLDTPWAVIYCIVIFMFHPVLGLIALLSACALVALAWLGDSATRARSDAAVEQAFQNQRLNASTLRAAEVAVAMNMAPVIVRRWAEGAHKAGSHAIGVALAGGRISSATKFLRQFVQVVMLAAGAYVTIVHNLTPGVMIAATVLLGRALAPAEQAIGAWRSMVEAREAWRRLGRLFAVLGDTRKHTLLPEPEGRLQVEGITFVPKPGAAPILRNISFQIDAGELLCVVGPSGSGKSTLARVLAGVWHGTVGKVRLDGAELGHWDRAQLGQSLGYLPQDIELIAGTVADNIRRFSDADDAAVIDAANLANAHAMIVKLPRAYDTEVGHEQAYMLSGGQRQRVGLARALYGGPRLVVLDEPNANLDAEGDNALQAALAELKARRVTVIVITQRTRVLALADKVLVLKEGVVERFGDRKDMERQAPANPAKGSPMRLA
jgi:PrtD family type I secretion system ABC transporter